MTDGMMDRWVERQTKLCMDGMIDRWMDGWMDGMTDGTMYR